MKPIVILDTECYRNYWLLLCKEVATGRIWGMEKYPGHALSQLWLPEEFTYVSFNGIHYDFPIIALALLGVDNLTLKAANDDIILHGLRHWHIREKYGAADLSRIDHIDLMAVAPGDVGLKAYGGRLHSKRLQDLPIDPAADISEAQRQTLRAYCANDLQTTQDLYESLTPQIDLRVRMSAEYGIDLRSKSDAQIAEAVIRSEIEKRTGSRVFRPDRAPESSFYYRPPAFIKFIRPELQRVLSVVCNSRLTLDADGYVVCPPLLDPLQIQVGDLIYAMRLGGLHSTEESVSHTGDLVDRDVTSYYPAVILGQRLFPEHLGPIFLEVYREIVERRLAAKAAGDEVTADSLKIVINGSFGKFGNRWSILYSPNLLMQVTITGQLAILMLIEALVLTGVEVVSGNTDGVVFKWHSMADYVIAWWEMVTGFKTEETQYKALYSKDVNNYIAIKTDGKVKAKGLYAPTGLQKNPTNRICVDAAIAYLADGTPPAATIRCCRDLSKFLTVRKAKGGSWYDGAYLGKVTRWYYAIGETRCIIGKVSKVARSEGARPVMDLPDGLPEDLDYEWYINETKAILEVIGCNHKL